MESSPYPYVTTARHGRAYFRMRPDAKAPHNRDIGSGACYHVGAEEDALLWSIKGWYAFEVFLTDDAEHLVRLGSWPRGGALSAEHLAIAFYQRDHLLASYSTKELIEDESKVRRSISHYQFRDIERPPSLDRMTNRFTLVTIDRLAWVFDVITGEVVSKTQLPPE